MTPIELLDMLGIKASVLVAGLSGGAMRALSRKSYKAREMIASPVCGALAAAYLTTPVVHYLNKVSWPLPPDEISAQHATAFLIGVCGMWIADAVLEFVVRRFKPGSD